MPPMGAHQVALYSLNDMSSPPRQVSTGRATWEHRTSTSARVPFVARGLAARRESPAAADTGGQSTELAQPVLSDPADTLEQLLAWAAVVDTEAQPYEPVWPALSDSADPWRQPVAWAAEARVVQGAPCVRPCRPRCRLRRAPLSSCGGSCELLEYCMHSELRTCLDTGTVKQ